MSDLFERPSNGDCPHCTGPRRGIYSTACTGCCLELLRQAPAGKHRQAMAIHLAATCPDDTWPRVIAAAKAEGLTR